MEDHILNRFEIEIKKAYYAFERYNSISTFVLLHFDDDLDVETLAKFVRISDKFLKINAHTYFINFAFTSHKDTFKAAQNLLLELDNHFNKRSSYIAIEELEPTSSPRMVVNKLVQILEETRKHSYSRIEDESILNATF